MAVKVLDLLPRLLALEDEHRRTKPDRRLSIESAAFLLSLEDPERALLRAIAQGGHVRTIAKRLEIEPAQIYARCEELARKLRCKMNDLDRLARDFAKYAS